MNMEYKYKIACKKSYTSNKSVTTYIHLFTVMQKIKVIPIQFYLPKHVYGDYNAIQYIIYGGGWLRDLWSN